MKKILVTGGLGYIGSHTVVELIDNDYDVTIVDNLANSDISVLSKIEEISLMRPQFFQIDLCSYNDLENVFKSSSFDAVIHFAGLKAVGESVNKPLEYYDNNLTSTLNLLKLMNKYGVNNLIFSSSATVYGEQSSHELFEDMQTGVGVTNPYGRTKVMIEQIIKDFTSANQNFNSVILRYANPIGAHSSSLIGENPNGIPNNLLPFIAQVASGRRDRLSVFGNDYPTPDGTCIRDYIHVVDLAKGHTAALDLLNKSPKNKFNIFNLGSGKGYSVLEVIKSFETANNLAIPYEIAPRRAGDLPEYYENADKAFKQLGWKTEKSLQDACRDSWNFQQNLG